MEVAPGIHRIGTDSKINAYLVEEAGQVTVVDAALPGFYRQLPGELAAMGRSIDDVRALILTHGHSDHVGFAERLRTDHHVPVMIEQDDAALARGEVKNPSSGAGPIKVGPLLRFLWHSVTRGGIRAHHLTEISTFGDGATLDVPGSPRVILTPGHTPGSAVLHVASRDALLVGDAFCTYAVTNGARGPRVAPFTADAGEAVRSLARIEDIQAGTVLPGHGDPWTGGVADAVRLVRTASAPR